MWCSGLSFIHSFIDTFIDSFIDTFIDSFIDTFIDSFIDSFIHSLSPAAIQSTPSWPGWDFMVVWYEPLKRPKMTRRRDGTGRDG